ncbi:hypothetical protein FKP32DRAFT_1548995, partial [Trametes sanguinea]
KKDKAERGVGMQNFKFTPAFDEFMHIVHIHSARAYRFLASQLPMRTERSIRYNISLQPRFPLGLSEQTFMNLISLLERLGYSGPVGLSCDDTKLSASLDPVYDKAQDGYFVLGGVGQPLRVANPENFAAEIAANSIMKAEKVR